MITIDRLIKDKMKIEEEIEIKHENYFVERYNENIEIKGIQAERFMEMVNKYGNNVMTLYIHLCYEGIVYPNLKDKNLWKQFNVTVSNPYEIVEKIFKPNEYTAIARSINLLTAGEIPNIEEIQETTKKLIKKDERARFYSYYIERGFHLDYLENLSFYEQQFFISSMYVNNEERNNDIVMSNPFLEKK